MKTLTNVLTSLLVVFAAMLLVQCNQDGFIVDDNDIMVETRAKPTVDIGNNLSFPVIWSDNEQITLRGTPEMEPQLEGEWWYVWGPDPIDPSSVIYSCPPDPENESLCADGSVPGFGFDNLVKAYLQKDADNVWQGGNVPGNYLVTYVDLIDWGDNLESVDWTTKSQIRTEVVLYKYVPMMTEYAMKHVSGWGISEMHGLATDLEGNVLEGAGTVATVFSDNARFTIQKLIVSPDILEEGMLEWVNGEGWIESEGVEDDLINEPIYNEAIHEGKTYSAEVNIKGKIIYGFTWNVRRMNDGEGYYRLTFSFDSRDNLFTSLRDAEIITPEEGVYVQNTQTSLKEDEGGGVAVLLGDENLTYIDVRIVAKTAARAAEAAVVWVAVTATIARVAEIDFHFTHKVKSQCNENASNNALFRRLFIACRMYRGLV